MKRRYIKTCPACKSHNITLYAGGITGTYECKDCGYAGAILVEIPKNRVKSRRRIVW